MNFTIFNMNERLTKNADARGGFATEKAGYALEVVFPEELLAKIPEAKQNAIIEVLKQDPRPAYHEDAERQYGVAFARFDVRFRVAAGVLTVFEVVEKRETVRLEKQE